MQKYVHRADGTRRNHASSRQPKVSLSFEDLKQDTPDLERTDSPHPQENRRPETARKVAVDSSQGQPFYATDLGSSSGASTMGAHGHDAMARDRDGPQLEHDDVQQSVRDRAVHRNPGHSDHRGVVGSEPCAPGTQDVQVRENAPQTHDQAESLSFPSTMKRKGFTDKYVSGDSFPDTTSGVLSTVDETEANEHSRVLTQSRHGHGTEQGVKSYQQFGIRQTQGHPSDDTVVPKDLGANINTGHVRDSEPKHRAGRVSHTDGSTALQQAESNVTWARQTHQGFQFGPNPRAISSANQPSPRTQTWVNPAHRLVYHQRPQQTGEPGRVHRGHISGIPSNVFDAHHQRHVGEQRAVHDIQELRNVAERRATPAVALPNQHFEQPIIDERSQLHSPSGNVELDTDNDEGLFRMDYAALKSRSFDPQLEPQNAPTSYNNDGASLQSKLGGISKVPIDGQSKFLRSLSKEEWEETGDWFMEGFTRLVGRMKASRQRQRDAAERFAMEIDDRHRMIEQKREHTDDAMDEMKENGAKVLQNTPKGRKAR